MKATINLNANGIGSLHLDDEDVSRYTRGFTLDARVGEMPFLRLDVLPTRGLVYEGDVAVNVIGEMRDLLQKLGWTPPGGAA
jgi:hypothetical protein